VSDINSLRNHVADVTPGTTVSVVINRDGSEKTVSVKLDEAETGRKSARNNDAPSADKAALGISVEKAKNGLVITAVNPDSRAADAGLQEGDVIQEVNRKPVDSVDALREAVRRTSDRPVLLLVEHEGQTRFVTVRPANS
jgi:serine protease Do